MGRIEHEGSTLVDIEETQGLLRKSRRTVFYLVGKGRLNPRHVPGSKKTWFGLSEVMGLIEVGETVGGQHTPHPRVIAHLMKWHPWALR